MLNVVIFSSFECHYPECHYAECFVLVLPFEMIRTESDEMCISIDQDCGSTALFIQREIKQGSGETERENVCECECWSKPKIASISIHKQRG